ncbi:hypothetical protein J6A31_06610 [bacterium]|nr:hypothetical protein [bacterium]
MANTKKHKNIKIHTASTQKAKSVKKEKKKTFLDTQVSLRTNIIIICIIAVLIISGLLTTVYFTGKNAILQQGVSDIPTLINTYFTGINTNDSNRLKICFNGFANDYYPLLETQNNYASTIKDKIDFKIDSIQIEESPYADIDALKTHTNIHNISDAKLCYVTIASSQIETDITINTKRSYYFVCYESSKKWYIWAIEENDISVTSAIDANGNEIDISGLTSTMTNDTIVIGNEYTGYAIVDKTWVPIINEPVGNIKSEVAYTKPDGNATISLSAIESELTAEEFAANVYGLFNENINTAESLQVTNCTFASRAAISIACYDKSSGTYFTTMIFESPLTDPYIHNISIEGTEDDIKTALTFMESYFLK